MAEKKSLKDIKLEDLNPKDLKPLALPVFLILVIIALFFVGYKTLWGRIADERAKLNTARKNEATLVQKRDLLSQVGSEISPYIDAATISIPEKNSSLLMISQLRQVVSQNVLEATDIAVSSPNSAEKGMSRVQLQFQVDGDLNQLISFINQFQNVAPIPQVEQVSITNVGGTSRAEVSLNVYFAPFPEQLPPLTEPVSELTSEERELLDILSQLQLPPLLGVSPSGPTFRSNPFQ